MIWFSPSVKRVLVEVESSREMNIPELREPKPLDPDIREWLNKKDGKSLKKYKFCEFRKKIYNIFKRLEQIRIIP